ncbi:MAG: type II toxin-antitoxin system RelE/ParE family toxin [Pseudomonadota bacterium]
MRELVFLTDAREDLREIGFYIAQESGSTVIALSFVDGIIERCGRLAGLPGTLGTARSELRPDLRSIAHENYVVFFRYIEDRVEIVNIIHAHRDLVRLFDS